MDLKALEGVALELARTLAPAGMEWFAGRPAAERKRDRTLVSGADRAIEEAARAFLAKETPHLGFLGEETGTLKRLADLARPRASHYPSGFALPEGALLPFELGLNEEVPEPLVLGEDTYWMVDPIDGTINFLARSPLWSTLVALVHRGVPVLGLVSLPGLDEVFVASRGNGARHGRLSQGLVSFRPCRVNEARSLSESHVSCSSPRTFLHRGIDGFFGELVEASAEMRTHSDAYGYTRILCGGIDAMIDPIVAPYDVASLQVLFDETPGAHFTTLHGHAGPSRHRMGSAVAASSRSLAEEILARYGAWLERQDCALPELAYSSDGGFAEGHRLAAERAPHARNATAGWSLAVEKGVAAFRTVLARAEGMAVAAEVCVEDVSVLVALERSVSAQVKNGELTTTPSSDTVFGVHVRAVAAGGCGLRTATLPLDALVTPESLVTEALLDAWQQAKERGAPPSTEILAWRQPVVGHFGSEPWEASLEVAAFRSALALLCAQREDEEAGIQTISSSVEVAVEKRLQLFLDGGQQTQSRSRMRVGAAVVARRGIEKRRAFLRLHENRIVDEGELRSRYVSELAVTRLRATALLDAPLVPEEMAYSHLALDADLLGLILHEALGHAAEGDLVELGSSGFGEPTEGDPRYVLSPRKVAPEWIDIVIDGALDNCGALGVDCEGTLPARKTIVRNGTLVDGIHTRQTARFARRAPDGCSRQEGVFHPSLNRMTSIWVQARGVRPLPLGGEGDRIDRPSPESVQKVLERDGFLRDGESVLYLSGWKGGTASCSNLEFRADVAFIHELRLGRAPRLLREANFTGIATECFLSAVAAYGPVLCRTIGTCGKDAQGVPTSDGGPAILVLEKNPRVSVIGSGESG